jgi:hypothetical protein
MDVKMVVSWCPQVVWQSQTPIRFPAMKQRLILGQEPEKSACLNELDVRKPLVVYKLKSSEELRLHNLA